MPRLGNRGWRAHGWGGQGWMAHVSWRLAMAMAMAVWSPSGIEVLSNDQKTTSAFHPQRHRVQDQPSFSNCRIVATRRQHAYTSPLHPDPRSTLSPCPRHLRSTQKGGAVLALRRDPAARTRPAPPLLPKRAPPLPGHPPPSQPDQARRTVGYRTPARARLPKGIQARHLFSAGTRPAR